MFRRVLLASVATLLMLSSALAAKVTTNPCEAREVVTAMKDTFAKGKLEDGRSLLSYGINVAHIGNVKTLVASKDKLVCGITITVVYRGESERISLRFTVQQFGDGTYRAAISGR